MTGAVVARPNGGRGIFLIIWVLSNSPGRHKHFSPSLAPIIERCVRYALPLASRGEYDIHSAARLEKPSCINRDG